ncbi:MAG TPA: glycosyltransferase family 2 protein [Acidimicrobiales bacterium]|nr:glycosyltransferase family 2 protein [Acidimicrobiales bacterium]
MSDALFLSVVLPAHNEITLLGSTVTTLGTGLDARGVDYEIIVVENGSRDGTLRLARLLAVQIERVRVLALPVGDYGAALASGFAAARGRYVVNVDVDYYDLAFVDAALAALESGAADLVLASKRAPGARDRRPVVRRFLTFGFANASRVLVGLEVSDAHGMKAMRREALGPIVDRCVMHRSVFDVEMVVRAAAAGIHAREIPASVVERRAPRTPVGRRTVESLLGLVRLRWVLFRESRPRDGHH